MSSYNLPDLTGQNVNHLQVNMPCFVYQVGQKIGFEASPIFANSLVITLTDGTGRSLVRDVDWEVKSDDIDQTATARAKLEDQTFNKTLVKSITIKSDLALNKPIAMTFQEFYDTLPGRIFDDGTPFEVTPDLIKSLVSGLADARQQIAHVNSPVAPNPTPPKLLPFDINCERSSNVISNEPIVVNTVAGAKVVRLAHGAFFANSLELKFNGVTLNPNTDYLPVVVSPLTERSTNKSGIYQYILLNGSYAGTLTATYHAVGGEVQSTDINAVYELMIAIKTYLNDGIFVTSETIPETPAFRAMNARLNLLEDGMRRILNGTPTYGDSTAGGAVTRPIAANDADFHWWTIATLYKVEGSNDIIKADQFKGRAYFPGSKISVAFTVDVNIDQTRNKVSMRTDSLIFDPNYTLFEDLSVAAQQFPMIRVVWNQAAESFSGAALQIGLPLPNLSDVMVVEDMSSSESCWIMSRLNEYLVGDTSSTPSAPQDNGFLLPDGISLWSEASNISYQEVFVPDYREGYLAYSGSQVQINSLTTINPTGGLFNIVLPDYFPANKAKSLIVTMLSADSTQVYDIVIPLTGMVSNIRNGRMNFVDSGMESMAMLATVTQDSLHDISISLNISEIANPLITGVPSPKTDIVRYIRVGV